MLALTGGKVMTMRGTVLDHGTVIVDAGKIVAVSAGGEAPAACRIIDVSGKVVTPGLIDAHTHLGIYGEGMDWAGEDANEFSEPVTPGLDVLDGINPADIGFQEAYQGGVTTVMVAPGSGNPVGGRCIIVKTKPAATVEQMLLVRHAGLKIAFGENPKRSYGLERKKMPYTRMATAAMIRETFWKARQYLDKQGDRGCQYDAGLEAVGWVLNREMPLRAHAHRADDIITAVRIAREFAVDIIIEHGTEAYLVADELARAGVPVILGPNLITRAKLELREKNMASPVILREQGITCALMSDHPVVPSCFLPVYAGLTIRYGLSADAALAMITCDAAKVLGLADRIGSLAPNLDADLVVWSGDPLAVASRPEMVMVDGQLSGD